MHSFCRPTERTNALCGALPARWRTAGRLFAVLVSLGGAQGCTRADAPAAAAMGGPTGLAVAGRAHDKIFVAMRGLDAVQIVDAAGPLRAVDFVRAPAQYFPLNVPVGPNPTELAASADGAYVFVVDAITSQVQAIDADAARVLTDANQAPLRAPLGPRESQPARIAGHPWASCTPSRAGEGNCVGRAYVTLRNTGSVAAVDVRQTADGGLQLRLDRTYPVGGAPGALCAHPSLPVLFVADESSGEVVRLAVDDFSGPDASVVAGTTARLRVGDDVGALAVSGDGSALAVARPGAEDVVVVVGGVQPATTALAAAALAAGTLRIAEQTVRAAPTPRCLATCGEGAAPSCPDPHPADAALCLGPYGYAQVPDGHYDGLWLGTAPRAIVAVSAAQVGDGVQLYCGQGGQLPQTFAEAFAVAGYDGSLSYVGLADAAGAAVLLDSNACLAPQLVQPAGAPSAADVLAPLADGAAALPRVDLLRFADAEPPKVGAMRTRGGTYPYALAWEGVLAGGDRAGGSGAIDADGRLYEVDGDGNDVLAQVALRPQTRDKFGNVTYAGDVLELLTPSLDDATCAAAEGGAQRLCALERRVVAVDAGDHNGPIRLRLDRPLHADCFVGPIAYRLRAGDSFLAGPIDGQGAFVRAPVRLAPGDSYGPGRNGVGEETSFFVVDPNLDVASATPACQRYADGRAGAGAPAWRSRLERTRFTVADPYATLQVARRAAESERQRTDRIGALPYGLAVVPANAARGPLLGMSFAASGGLFVGAPTDSRKVGVGEQGRLLQ